MKRKEFIQASAAAILASRFSGKNLLNKDYGASPKIVRANEGPIENVLGDIQTLKISGADTNGQVVLIEESNPPGTAIPMHVHSKEDEIFKVLEGKLEVTVGNETTILETGDLAFAPKGIPHSWKVVGEQTCKTILTAFPAGIELMFSELGSLPAGPPDFPKVAEICGRYGIEFIQ